MFYFIGISFVVLVIELYYYQIVVDLVPQHIHFQHLFDQSDDIFSTYDQSDVYSKL